MSDDYPLKIPTPAATVIARFGFSQREAASFYGVRVDTVKKWQSGKMPMPDDLLATSYQKLDQLASITEFIADRYCDQAANNETGEHMAEQYISLPTPNQMLQGSFPFSDGFFAVLFGDIAARCYAADESRYCFLTPCAPLEELGPTNMWLIPWFQRALVMDRCVEVEDEVVRFDVEFYDYLRSELRAWRNVSVQLPRPLHSGIIWGDEIRLELPYIPDWYDEGETLSDAELALLNTTTILKISMFGPEDFSDMTDLLPQCLFFVEDDNLRPMMEAMESGSDADLNATNENLAQIMRDVFGSRSKLVAQATAK